jgi:hypothetical protein
MFLPSEYGQQRVAGRLAYYSQTQRHSNSFFRGETEKKKKNDTITENKIDDVITNLTVGSLYRAL